MKEALPFIIVADLRSGSTLLATSLDSHPAVRCHGELFHPELLPDNQVGGGGRYRMSGAQLAARAFAGRGLGAAGFRAMVFLPAPSQPQWADAWDFLRAVDGLRVIYLTRRNALAQYASLLIARRSGVYHPYDHDPILNPKNRPRLTVEVEEFHRWRQERAELFARRRQTLAGKPSLKLGYEDLTAGWPKEIMRVQEFLGVEPLPLLQAKQKQEQRPLSEVIANYEQVLESMAGSAGRTP